jgi:hypothetical protein
VQRAEPQPARKQGGDGAAVGEPAV